MAQKVTVVDIVREYLQQHGYDGLWNEYGECSCTPDDLVPCGESLSDCQPGYKVKCDCGGGCMFHIGPKMGGTGKPVVNPAIIQPSELPKQTDESDWQHDS